MTFKYAQNIESDEPVMLINKHIGMDDEDGMGIDGSLFQEELMALDNMGKRRIQVWINSVGGIVMDGYNICTAILKTKTPVDTYCMGMAASIAGVIFQTGRKRTMADYGILMYHNPYSGNQNSSPLLDSMRDSLNTLIRSKTDMTEDAVQRMMDRTSFIQADEALQMKLCDQVEATVKLNTKYMPRTVNDGRRYYEAANRVLNKIFFKETNTKMIKVTNKLGLTEDANENSILAAIEVVENRANAAETARSEAEAALNTVKAELEQAKNNVSELQAKYDEANEKVLAAETETARLAEEAATEKATNVVNEAVQLGKVKNDAAVVAEWVKAAKADFEGTKAMLDGIPTNKTAVKIEVKGGKEGKEEGALKVDMGAEMLKISNKISTKK